MLVKYSGCGAILMMRAERAFVETETHGVQASIAVLSLIGVGGMELTTSVVQLYFLMYVREKEVSK